MIRQTVHQPVNLHAVRERAPCEPVCPVGATVPLERKASTTWSTTAVSARATARTTAPYKVRRFNFLLYQDFAI